MSHVTGAKELRLLLILTQNRGITTDELCERLEMSRRTLFRYLETLRNMGFGIRLSNGCYSIDPASPFFNQLTGRIHFSEDEAITLQRVLNSVTDKTPGVRHLRDKLAALYDAGIIASHSIDEHVAQNISQIYQAIRERRICILENYTSGNSRKTSNRIVEPYQLLAGNSEVRCYEIASQKNKTFKISRAQSVKLLDLNWSNEKQHKQVSRDIFHFSGEERKPICLRLGKLATNLLIEEYPESIAELERYDDGTSRLRTEVCSFIGVGRFVIGLADDIEVEQSEEFKNYLKTIAEHLISKFH